MRFQGELPARCSKAEVATIARGNVYDLEIDDTAAGWKRKSALLAAVPDSPAIPNFGSNAFRTIVFLDLNFPRMKGNMKSRLGLLLCISSLAICGCTSISRGLLHGLPAYKSRAYPPK